LAVSVLFVDDDPDLRDAVGDTLGLMGDDVSCVLASSLNELEARPGPALACSLAILDVNLGPGRPGGVEVARWLESRAFHGAIVFLTGHGQSDPRVALAASVANVEVLSKPISAERLATLVDEARVRP
jgi:DNA-binding NtrC family response regulator